MWIIVKNYIYSKSSFMSVRWYQNTCQVLFAIIFKMFWYYYKKNKLINLIYKKISIYKMYDDFL